MKKFLYLLLATAMLATFGCTGDTNTNSVGSPNPNPFQPKGTVTGVLVDACTNEPIANADVYIMDKKATTNHVGMFTIKEVPANTAVGSESTAGGDTLLANGLYTHETYNVVIDLTKVNAERAKLLGASLYPSIAYHTVKVAYTSLGESSDPTEDTTTATNHDTPVDGFVANIKPMVGKLSATLNVQAVSGIDSTPLTGATVQLISLSPFDGINTPNNVTGNLVNTIATATTGADGKASFTNVEAKHIFYAKVTWTDPVTGHVWTGREGITSDGLSSIPVVWTECDGTTTNFYLEGPNPAIALYDASDNVDTVHPFVVSTTPTNLADIAPSATTQVVFTFSEVLKPTQYLLNTTEASSVAGGLWNDVTINAIGPKAGNVAHTITWDSTTSPRVLTITLATAASYKYTASIAGLVNNAANVTDLNGNRIEAPEPLQTVIFTTGGGLDVTPPTISRQGTSNTIEWLPVANAYVYRVYLAEVRNDVVTGAFVFKGETGFTLYDLGALAFNDGEVKVSYLARVTTTNTDGTESVVSNEVVIDDQTDPIIVTAATTNHAALIAGMGINSTLSGHCTVTYSEVMDKTTINDASDYTFAFAGAITATATRTITNVVVTYVANATVVDFDWTVATDATGTIAAGAVTISPAGTDLNGNSLSNIPFTLTP